MLRRFNITEPLVDLDFQEIRFDGKDMLGVRCSFAEFDDDDFVCASVSQPTLGRSNRPFARSWSLVDDGRCRARGGNEGSHA